MAASSIIGATYGREPIKSYYDPLISKINDLMDRVGGASRPGASLVDIFPVMNHLPLWAAKWKRDGLAYFEGINGTFENLMDGVEDRVVSVLLRHQKQTLLLIRLGFHFTAKRRFFRFLRIFVF